MTKVAVVVPAYNEEKTVAKVIDELKQVCSYVIVVDDGSKDRTYEMIQHADIILQHLINRGLGAALSTGIKAALKTDAEIIITFDSDAQHQACDIPRMVQQIEKNRADVVIGSRLIRYPKSMPLVKQLGNKMLNIVTLVFYGIRCTDTQSGMRAFSRNAAAKINIMVDRYGVSSEIISEIRRNKLRLKEIPIDAIYLDPRKGTTVIDGFKICFDLIVRRIW